MARTGRSRAHFGVAFVALLALCSSACQWFVIISPTPVAASRLRLVNVGPRGIGNIVVLFRDERVQFGDLPVHGSTSYRSTSNGVFRYAAYEFRAENQLHHQPVIDWVGEAPLEGEAFMYSVELIEHESGRPFLKLTDVRRDE